MAFPLGVPALRRSARLRGVRRRGFPPFTSVFSVWLLDAVYELDEAARPAPASRSRGTLRFRAGLHDVMGRNLS